MDARNVRLLIRILLSVFSIFSLINSGQAQKSGKSFSPVIPKTWDDEALASLELPLASTGVPPEHISSDYYYRMVVRPIYKSYPIYAPGKEPSDYLEWLKQQEPEIVFDPAKLKTEADWIKAGELAFDAPIAYDADPLFIVRVPFVRNSAWYQKTGTPVTKDGVMPFARYVIRKKGEVEVGSLSKRYVPHASDARRDTDQRGAGEFPIRPRACLSRAGADVGAEPRHQSRPVRHPLATA